MDSEVVSILTSNVEDEDIVYAHMKICGAFNMLNIEVAFNIKYNSFMDIA